MSSLARYIVDAVVVEHRSPTDLARDHNISRSWIYCLLQRFKEGGYASLEPRSRRPRSCSHQAAADVRAEVLRLRNELTEAVHDAGPGRKLRTARKSHGGTERREKGPAARVARVRRRWTFAIAWSPIGSPRIRPASWILRSGLSSTCPRSDAFAQVPARGAGSIICAGGTRWPRANSREPIAQV